MNFGGHLITAWLISRADALELRERRFITLMGVAPDIDAFSVFAPALLGDWHRTFGHNIFFGLLAPLLLFLFFPYRRSFKLLPFAYIAILSHYILDLIITGWWAFIPFWPINDYAIFTSKYIPEDIMKYYIQVGLEIILLFAVIIIYIRTNVTFLEIISEGVDKFITNFITIPFKHHCEYCKARAFYRCSVCGKHICGRHLSLGKKLSPLCKQCN